jgi:LysM repeat protein/predicted nucleotidyltransferase
MFKESILDIPHEELDSLVWEKTEEGLYVLTDLANGNIQTIVDYVSKCFSLKNPSVKITGSITSNQYTSESDIDIHISFEGLTEENSEEMNKKLRQCYETFKSESNASKIGNHPIEVYFQSNPYQDLMSVGCFDFNARIWLVGPELKPVDYDPYAEFYSDDMHYLKDIIGDIRNNILDCYETAMVIQGTKNEEFKNSAFGELKQKIKRGVDIFNAAKQCRKVFSNPTSVEDALEKRTSKKWKIADSSFKLMDKFGYLKILKQFSNINDKLDKVDGDITSSTVINIIKNNMNTTSTIDESLSDLRKYFVIASLLVIPGLMSTEALANDLSKIDSNTNNFYETSNDVQDAIYNAMKDTNLYGGYAASNVINMVARTLYVEGHAEQTKGRKAILSVILNRCDNDRNHIAAVIKQDSAFSCWNAMTNKDWKKFKYKIPTSGDLSIVDNPNNKKIWNECVDLATQLFNGTFKSTIGNRNAYMNPAKASEKAKSTWGKKLDIWVGNHKFGYVKTNDPKYYIPGTFIPKKNVKVSASAKPVAKASANAKSNIKATAKTKTKLKTISKPIYYNTVDGDTLSSIAKRYNTTPKNILKLNPTIKNPNKIKIGQKIRIK